MHQPRKLAVLIDKKCNPQDYYDDDGRLKTKRIREIISAIFSDHTLINLSSLEAVRQCLEYHPEKRKLQKSLQLLLKGEKIDNPQQITELLDSLQDRIELRGDKNQNRNPDKTTLDACAKLRDNIILHFRKLLQDAQANYSHAPNKDSATGTPDAPLPSTEEAHQVTPEQLQESFRSQFFSAFTCDHANITITAEKIVFKKLGKSEKAALQEILFTIISQYYSFLFANNFANDPRFFSKRTFLESFFTPGEKCFSLATLEAAITDQLKKLIDNGSIARHKEKALKGKPVYTISSKTDSERIDS